MADSDHSHANHQTHETVAVVAFWVGFECAVRAISWIGKSGFRGKKAAFLWSSGVFVLVGGGEGEIT